MMTTTSNNVALPFAGMIIAECVQAGLIVISKAIMSQGMSNLIFVFYSNSLASLLMLLCSFLFHRNRSQRPPLTLSSISSFFLLGFLGCFAQIFGYTGINYSSPTLGTAMLNLVPGFTFILAIIFRMEELDWRKLSSIAKLVGTVVSIGGAFIITLYKGPALLSMPSSLHMSNGQILSQPSDWVIGALFLVADCVMSSSFTIVQAAVLKKFPAEFIVVFFYMFFVAIQSGIICLVWERDISAWSLKSKTRLFAVLYSAVFGSAVQVGISTWCLKRTGPVFVSMFKPLGIVIAVILGVILLGDTFYLGSLIGAIVIVIGFYSVIWGKGEESKVVAMGVISSQSSSEKVPLLQSNIEEI
ncbi:hypothetical protein ACFE04_024270 [Oxalis oulophora]